MHDARLLFIWNGTLWPALHSAFYLFSSTSSLLAWTISLKSYSHCTRLVCLLKANRPPFSLHSPLLFTTTHYIYRSNARSQAAGAFCLALRLHSVRQRPSFEAAFSPILAAHRFFSVSLPPIFLHHGGFRSIKIPPPGFFLTSWSLFNRERKCFFSRAEGLFVVIKKPPNPSGAPRKQVFLTFSTTFLPPIFVVFLSILPFLHVKFCYLWNYFCFCVKKFVCVFGGNDILFYFCTRFPTLSR